jgi:tRNA 2-thiouridine synthesizing protein A
VNGCAAAAKGELLSTHRLDVTGLFCPLPILLAAREMRKLQPGDLLEVLGDDPGIREDMPVWCERAGHRLVEMKEEGGQIRSLVEKGEGRASSGSTSR